MKLPPMIPVQSSKIKEVGHDMRTNNLYVKFSNGDVFVYFRVTREQFEELRSSESVGKKHAEMFKGAERPHDFSRMVFIGDRWTMEK